ncbi:MAG: fumarylacetoacetate hydrolase family protein [Rhodospirillaceae bacterium]|jgi:fumarylacetoacetate (FAA) hydrolase
MKLASLKSGRDGHLVIVSNDLSHYVDAADIAPTLQAALENWQSLEPLLRERSDNLTANKIDNLQPFDPAACAAPLPRAYHWVDGSVYLNHMKLVRQARGAEMPDSFLEEPLVYQGGSDFLLGPRDPILARDEAWGIDLEAEVAVITDDVPAHTKAEQAAAHIKLVLLANDISLRNLIPGELGKGFGFYQSKPPTAFSPVAVTPDALGDRWDGRKLHGAVNVTLNEKKLGDPDAGADMYFDFGQLIEHVTMTRPLGAGTIIGSGTISNEDRSRGSCCLAEVRTIETIETGGPKTPFMSFGDRVSIDMTDENENSIFGRIEQVVTRQ